MRRGPTEKASCFTAFVIQHGMAVSYPSLSGDLVGTQDHRIIGIVGIKEQDDCAVAGADRRAADLPGDRDALENGILGRE